MPEPTHVGRSPQRPRREHRRAAPSAGPSSLRRDLLLRLRLDGPRSPDQLAARLGASRTGVLQQLRALEAAHLVSRHDRPPRRRPAAAPVRRHARRPGSLPADLRRARRGPAVGDRGGRRRRPARGGLRGAPPAARRPRPRPARRARAGRRAARRTGSASSPRSRPPRAISPRRVGRSPTAAIRLASTTARSTTWPAARRRPARPSWTCSARSSARDVVRETHIASGDRCCSYRIEERPPSD